MSYPSKLLSRNETVIVEFHPYWSILVPPFVVMIACLGVLAGVAFVFPSSPLWLLESLGVLCVIPVVWFGLRVIQRQTTSLVVTNLRLALQTGIVVKKGWDARLERINDVSFDQSLWGRIFRVGDIYIDTGGEAGTKAVTRVPHPDGIKALIFERQSARIQELRSDPMQTGPNYVPSVVEGPGQGDTFGDPPGPSSQSRLTVVEQLERLDQLRARSVITNEEFELEKARLLGKN